jgi:hypothetical protein
MNVCDRKMFFALVNSHVVSGQKTLTQLQVFFHKKPKKHAFFDFTQKIFFKKTIGYKSSRGDSFCKYSKTSGA